MRYQFGLALLVRCAKPARSRSGLVKSSLFLRVLFAPFATFAFKPPPSPENAEPYAATVAPTVSLHGPLTPPLPIQRRA